MRGLLSAKSKSDEPASGPVVVEALRQESTTLLPRHAEIARLIEEAWKAVQESPGLSGVANSVPMLSWLDTLEQSLLKAFGAKHFDELGCGTFMQNVNKVISGVVADGRSADTLPSVSATGPLGSDEVGGKCPSEDAWCQALEAAMATASEVGSVLEGLQQLEGLAHRHLGISSDMGTSLLSQSLKHRQAFALTARARARSPHLTSPCVALLCTLYTLARFLELRNCRPV